MTDLEMTKLCAAAMGIAVRQIEQDLWTDIDEIVLYDPLHDKAQAMDLVILLGLTLERTDLREEGWEGYSWAVRSPGVGAVVAVDADLLRAICLCAAYMQASK